MLQNFPNVDTVESIMSPAQLSISMSDKSYFLGVSLMSNKFFSKRKLCEYLSLFDANKHPFLLLVADSLEAVNYECIRMLNRGEALRRSSINGENYLRGYSKLGCDYKRLIPVLTSSIEQQPDYHIFYESTLMCFRTDSHFRQAVRDTVMQNLGDRVAWLLSDNSSNSPTIERYVLGELSISLYLYFNFRNTQLTQIIPGGKGIFFRLREFKTLLNSVGLDHSQCALRGV